MGLFSIRLKKEKPKLMQYQLQIIKVKLLNRTCVVAVCWITMQINRGQFQLHFQFWMKNHFLHVLRVGEIKIRRQKPKKKEQNQKENQTNKQINLRKFSIKLQFSYSVSFERAKNLEKKFRSSISLAKIILYNYEIKTKFRYKFKTKIIKLLL